MSGLIGTQAWLGDLLREATGVNELKLEDRPGISASVMVRVDEAVGAESTERLSLQWQAADLALCTWPAELKGQAKATYRTGRAQQLTNFLAGALPVKPDETSGCLIYPCGLL